MDKASETMASCTLEETLQRLNVSDGTTFPASLFRSKTSGQLLYLEAGKDFVDALLSFLLLPVGTIIHMLTTALMKWNGIFRTSMQVKPVAIGISSIFDSVQKFSISDLQVANEHLTRPRPAAIGCSCRSSNLPMLSALEKASILPSPIQRSGVFGDYYMCGNSRCRSSGAISKNTKCTSRQRSDHSQGPYSLLEKEVDLSTVGFVKANSTFIVTDNLEIMPLTTNKSMNVLSKLNVDSLADLEGNDITVSLTQILQLLHSALTSNSCLSEVFGKSVCKSCSGIHRLQSRK